MKQAMIFAAGLGTRLKPLTDTMPKALVKVGGKPLLEHVVLRLKDAGFERIVVNVHHFADQIIDYLKENSNFGLDIRISDERDGLLETGGGIKKALPLFDADSPILIHNVDILSNIDLAEFYSHAHDVDALLLVSQRQTKRYLVFDKDRRLVGWTNIETGEVKGPIALQPFSINPRHRRPLNPQPSTFNLQPRLLAFSGIHVFHPSLAPLLSQWSERFPIMDFYLKHCEACRFVGFEQKDLHLLDVGKLDSLELANKFIRTP